MLAMRCAARGCPQKASRLPTLPMTGILSGAGGKDRVDRVNRALATRAWSKEKAEEHKQYWDEVLGAVDKPSAKRLLQYIDTSVPLGLAGFGRGPRSSRSKAEGAPLPARPPSYSFFYDTKLQHPDKVVLCRVVGTDRGVLALRTPRLDAHSRFARSFVRSFDLSPG